MPKIKTKKLMVRGKTDREWNTIPAAGAGVYPVVKTDGMTQPVGRDPNGRLWTEPGSGLNPVEKTEAMTSEVGQDEQGRLWVDPTGTGHGLEAVAFGKIYTPGDPEKSGDALFFRRDKSNDLYVLLSELFEKMGISRFTVKAVPPTAEDVGKATDGWFDIGTQTLYICEGIRSGVYKWTPVSGSGSSGLPEYTEADEGKVLQIVGGKPVWVTLQSAPTPPVEEIALSINDDGSVTISGVVLEVQDDGAVLVSGAELALQDDGAVMIR